MNSQWVEVKDEPEQRILGWFTPLRIIGALLGALAVIVTLAIVLNRATSDAGIIDVTIGALRSDPKRYDNHNVALIGTVADVYSIPVLDQYGIYDFRDETGSMLVLTNHGIPPEDGRRVRLIATYNGSVTLDEHIKRLVSARFGSVIGSIVDQILPGIPLNVTYLAHDHYETLE